MGWWRTRQPGATTSVRTYDHSTDLVELGDDRSASYGEPPVLWIALNRSASGSPSFNSLVRGGDLDRGVGFDGRVGERAELALIDEGAEHGVDHPCAEQRGNLPHVVVRRDFDQLHADQSFAGNDAQHAEDFARGEPARLRGTGAGGVSRVDAVDVEGKKDRLGASPGVLQSNLTHSIDTPAIDVGHGDDGRVPLAGHRRSGAVARPAADANLHQVGGGGVGDVRGVEERRAVHPLVVVVLGQIEMAVEVDDADDPVKTRGDAADIGVSDGVIAAEHDREDGPLVDVADGFVDLIEGLFDVGGDHRDVTDVDHVERFPDIDAHLEVVAAVERGDRPDGPRPEARSRTIGRAAVKRSADDGDVLPAELAHVSQEGARGEGAAIVKTQTGAVEQGYGAIAHALRRRQPMLQIELEQLLHLRRGELRLPLQHPAAYEPLTIHRRLRGPIAQRHEPFAPVGALYHSRVRNLRDCPSLCKYEMHS